MALLVLPAVGNGRLSGCGLQSRHKVDLLLTFSPFPLCQTCRALLPEVPSSRAPAQSRRRRRRRRPRPHVPSVITLQTSVSVSPHHENFSSRHGCFLPCHVSRLVFRSVKNPQHGGVPSLLQLYGVPTLSVLILCCLSYHDLLAFPQISSGTAPSPSPSLSTLLPPAFIFLLSFHLLPCSWHSSVFNLCQSNTSIFTTLHHSPHMSAPALQFSYIHVGEVATHQSGLSIKLQQKAGMNSQC